MSSISDKVTKIIVDKLGVDESEVTSEASFTNDLGADSLDTVELIMEFEKEFDLSIPDEQAENIQTVGQAIEYLGKGNERIKAHASIPVDPQMRFYFICGFFIFTVFSTPGFITNGLGSRDFGPLKCKKICVE